LLRAPGQRARAVAPYRGAPCELVVALHAQKSAEPVALVRRRQRGAARVVLLAGTDLYGRRAPRARARRSLRLADRLVVLHPAAAADLPRDVRTKARVILQSAVAAARPRPRPRRGTFQVAVVGHLRAVKDPFRAALA